MGLNLDEFIQGINVDSISKEELDTFSLHYFRVETIEELEEFEITEEQSECASEAIIKSLVAEKERRPERYMIRASMGENAESINPGEEMYIREVKMTCKLLEGQGIYYYLVYIDK